MTESDDDQDELFPENIRKIGFWASLLFSLALITYYIAFIFHFATTSPKDLEISNLLIFSATSFLFFSIPWHKLGLSLKKFGPLEFERKLEGQSEEHIKDISALENKIAELEAAIVEGGRQVPIIAIQPTTEEQQMRELIVKFLTEYKKWSFSPSRIETWGAQQPGYSMLADNSSLLRRLLRSLVYEGILKTSVSKKGNTLFRVNS